MTAATTESNTTEADALARAKCWLEALLDRGAPAGSGAAAGPKQQPKVKCGA
jgi:hypothetical protein